MGHTDAQFLSPASKARFGGNLGLSKARAEAVINALVRDLVGQGQAVPLRLSSEGQGDQEPLGPDNNEKGRALNRRVELTLELAAPGQGLGGACVGKLDERIARLRQLVEGLLSPQAKGKVRITVLDDGAQKTLELDHTQGALPLRWRGRLAPWVLLGQLLLGPASAPADEIAPAAPAGACVTHRLDPLRLEPKLNVGLRDQPLWLPPANPTVVTVERYVTRTVQAESAGSQHFTLRPNFASGSDDMDPESVVKIQEAAQSLSQAVQSLSVIGYTDDQHLSPATARRFGDNNGLSNARARAVAAIFLSALPPALRPQRGAVSMDGRGQDEPVASNATKEGRAQNRRVEVTVETAALPGQVQSIVEKESVTETAQPRAAEFLLYSNYPAYVSSVALCIYGPDSHVPLRVIDAGPEALNGGLALGREGFARPSRGAGRGLQLCVGGARRTRPRRPHPSALLRHPP